MMLTRRTFLRVAAPAVLVPRAALAAGWLPLAKTAAYTGPGDIVSSATAWWGLQAYSAAYAAPGTNPAIDLHNDGSGAFVATINILSTGLLDTATAATVIAGGASRIGKAYDQTGNGRHITQATNGQRPQLQLNVLGTLPSMFFDGVTRGDVLQTAGAVTIPQPYSYEAVAQISAAGGVRPIIGSVGDTATSLAYRAGSLSAVLSSGAGEIAQATSQSAFHCWQGICPSNTGTIQSDGSATTAAGIGTTGYTTALTLGSNQAGGFWDGYIGDCGIWSLDNTAFLTSMNANAHSAKRWNF